MPSVTDREALRGSQLRAAEFLLPLLGFPGALHRLHSTPAGGSSAFAPTPGLPTLPWAPSSSPPSTNPHPGNFRVQSGASTPHPAPHPCHQDVGHASVSWSLGFLICTMGVWGVGAHGTKNVPFNPGSSTRPPLPAPGQGPTADLLACPGLRRCLPGPCSLLFMPPCA